MKDKLHDWIKRLELRQRADRGLRRAHNRINVEMGFLPFLFCGLGIIAILSVVVGSSISILLMLIFG